MNARSEDFGARLQNHVFLALRDREALCRRNGQEAPLPLPHLMAELGFGVAQGQRVSSLAPGGRSVEVVYVEPLAVNYEAAAQMLGVSVSTLKREIKAGRLKPVSFGGARVLRVADLKARLGEQIEDGGKR